MHQIFIIFTPYNINGTDPTYLLLDYVIVEIYTHTHTNTHTHTHIYILVDKSLSHV